MISMKTVEVIIRAFESGNISKAQALYLIAKLMKVDSNA